MISEVGSLSAVRDGQVTPTYGGNGNSVNSHQCFKQSAQQEDSILVAIPTQ